MICNTPKEILAEIKKHMDLNNIQTKDLAIRMHKSQQSISQFFNNGNPKSSTLCEICSALDLQIDISAKNKSDTK